MQNTLAWTLSLLLIGVGVAFGQDPAYMVTMPDGQAAAQVALGDISLPIGMVVAAFMLGRIKPTIRIELVQPTKVGEG